MIDVHTHCHLSKHWGCEWHRNWQPVYGHEYADRSPEQYDEAMAAAGSGGPHGHDPFFRAAAEAGLILLWHMDTTPSPEGRLELSNPLLVDDVARRHPSLKQIIAHLRHPWQRETIVVLRKNRNVFGDVSAAWARPLDGFMALVRAQEWGVVPKLLFGSDYPMWSPADACDGLHRLGAMRSGNLPAIEPATVEWLLDGDPRPALGLAA